LQVVRRWRKEYRKMRLKAEGNRLESSVYFVGRFAVKGQA
jgi:hypothetical protein